MFIQNTLTILTIFLASVAIALDMGINDPLIVISAILLLIVLTIERRISSKKISFVIHWVRLGLIGLFHYATKLDWVFVLYFISLIRFQKRSVELLKPKVALWINWSVFVLIYFINHDWNDLQTLFAAIFSAFVFYILFKVSERFDLIEDRNRKLSNQSQYLSTHDSLTGLVNFQEFHKQLHLLIENKKPLILILIDCNDLKSTNLEQGFQAGNRILKQMAELLQIVFSNAHTISRYGGDEFALTIQYESPNQKDKIDHLLQKELPRLTGMRMTYGTAVYPRDGETKDDLILVAEANLFDMKRKQWLEKEEHFLRTEKLRVVGELASGMAHELRNPLTTIQGFLQLAKNKGYRIEPWYDIMMSEISRMNELTAEFLQFSKPHTTHYKVQDLNKCVERVIHLMNTESLRTGHRIEYIKDPGPFPMLMDQDKIVQMLLNIVKNSYESMEHIGVVTITMKRDSGQIHIAISDCGIGIEKEALENIFNPFFTTKDNGTGLGLSICHKIVQDHGGVIEVESEIGKGTTFQMTLPLAEA